MTISKAVVPVAGRGTRMQPLTLYQPKELLPLGMRPALSYILDELGGAGVREILLVTSAEKQVIEKVCASVPFSSWAEAGPAPTGSRVWSVRQEEPLGLADALRYAEAFCAGDPFVLALGDCLMVEPPAMVLDRPRQGGTSFVARLIDAHERSAAACTVGVEPVPRERTPSYGIVAPTGGSAPIAPETAPFALRDIVEKPLPEATPSLLAIAGRYVCSAVIFDALRRLHPSPRGEYELPDALRDLVRRGHLVQALVRHADERRYDVGSPMGYIAAYLALALADPAGQQALALLPTWARDALATAASSASAPEL